MIECDELATFVGRKDRQVWIWLAMERKTRRIVGCFVGPRDAVGAFGLWEHMATPFLDAVCHTDKLGAYKSVVFEGRQRIGGTQHIERFNCTLRQRLARLTRKTLAFSRKLDHLIGLVWLFIHHYNASLLGIRDHSSRERARRSR
ncbi:IS1 family transposase [Deinococcus peraridilitoris]|uniref:IS1 family transposase n=1 Tax=Deinococcus peraridilitoris TaxID=432329 RepID=UPI0002FF88CE